MAKRIATNRDFMDKSVEYIELHDNGALMWVAEDEGNIFIKDDDSAIHTVRWLGDNETMSCSFPVDIDFVAEFFTKIGRSLDLSKLPTNTIHYPYVIHIGA
jgi:hypothetical protein